MNVFKRTIFSKGCEDSLLYAQGLFAGMLVCVATASIGYVWGRYAVPYLGEVLIPNAILKPMLKEKYDC